MVQISGKAGEVRVSAATIAGIKSWTVDYVQDALDTTDFGDLGIKSYIAGLSGWSGSFEGFKDGVPTGIGSIVALILMESQTSNQTYTGSALITGSHPSAAIDGVVNISYDFQGTAALTVATA